MSVKDFDGRSLVKGANFDLIMAFLKPGSLFEFEARTWKQLVDAGFSKATLSRHLRKMLLNKQVRAEVKVLEDGRRETLYHIVDPCRYQNFKTKTPARAVQFLIKEGKVVGTVFGYQIPGGTDRTDYFRADRGQLPKKQKKGT